MQQIVQIYVPVPGSKLAASLARGSGIVGRAADERISIYFESNRFDDAALVTWQSRVRTAASRILSQHPTTSKGSAHPNELTRVGTLVQYAPDDNRYAIGISDMVMLAAYTQEDPLDLLSAPTHLKSLALIAQIASKMQALQPMPVDLVNAAVERHLPELARATGNTVAGLQAMFAPRSAAETWFGQDGKNQPGYFLQNVASHQTLNFKRWPA